MPFIIGGETVKVARQLAEPVLLLTVTTHICSPIWVELKLSVNELLKETFSLGFKIIPEQETLANVGPAFPVDEFQEKVLEPGAWIDESFHEASQEGLIVGRTVIKSALHGNSTPTLFLTVISQPPTPSLSIGVRREKIPSASCSIDHQSSLSKSSTTPVNIYLASVAFLADHSKLTTSPDSTLGEETEISQEGLSGRLR